MINVLSDLAAAGWIDKLDGQDDRLQKMQKASQVLGAAFKKSPRLLIPAILAALDSDVTIEDPAIQQAEQALVDQWPTVASVHTDKPIGIYRSLLFAGCAEAAEGRNAAILWLTAADTLPFSNLGRAEIPIRNLISSFADTAETQAISLIPESSRKRKASELPALEFEEGKPYKIDRKWLFTEVGAASGPQNQQSGGQPFKAESNPHWANDPTNWTWQFANRMKDVLGAVSDALAKNAHEQQHALVQKLVPAFQAQAEVLQEAIAAAQNTQTSDQVRLDTLWWYESLYSPSQRTSYRDMDPALALVVMPIDLLSITPAVTPASVAYVLFEAVGKLPQAGFENRIRLTDLLSAVSRVRNQLSKDNAQKFSAPNDKGRLSIRDMVKLCLDQGEIDPQRLLRQAHISNEATMTIPQIARAVLRQEQAVRLAGAKK